MNPHGERPCPVCGEKMKLAERTGTEIDICEEHGVWLDAGELAAIVTRVKRQQRHKSSIAYKRGKASGKVSGVLWGPLSFLFD